MSEKTMADLRREVAQRLNETLHGREIDTYEKGMPEVPHMLGIVTIGAISTDKAISGSILDPSHEFWDNYYEDVKTKNAAASQVKSAIQSLKDDGVLRITSPYGEEAGIMYCEVGHVDSPQNKMSTVCTECGSQITTEPQISHSYGFYMLEFDVSCPDCDFSGTLEKQLNLHTE